MNILLLSDVAKVGRRGEVKELPDGYARNFILARGLGRVATDSIVKSAALETAAKVAKKKEEGDRIDAAIEAAARKPIVLRAPGSPDGQLFASVKSGDIAEGLRKEGIFLPVEAIELAKPIKLAGSWEVPLKSPSGKKGIVKVEITS